MTSEAYQNLSLDRKGLKRPSRPKLLKLTDVSMPNRSRKKTKFKLKERSHSNVRERIYDDPAYTDDISHLAIPFRRNSGPDKVETLPLVHKRKSGVKESQYVKRAETSTQRRDGSSSSDNMPLDGANHKRGQSLERAIIMERSPKKREKRDRAAKQKRNLSLDNTLSNSLRRSLEKSEMSLKTASVERARSRQKQLPRQNTSDGWSSCLAATSDSSKATENEEVYSSKKDSIPSKMQIGKRFLRGEIGIKSFNYYLLKEGLKSSKKFMDKQRNSLTKSDSKKLHSKSEENIYEEIFFMDKNSEPEESVKYPECELCVQQCTKENCKYCLEDMERSHHEYYSLERTTRDGTLSAEHPEPVLPPDYPSKGAHILQYQSYNPNNPGVYKIETTPVAFTSDYNPIHHVQYTQKQQPIHQQLQQHQQQHHQYQTLPQQHHVQHRGSKSGGQIPGTRINTKSSSSSDSLHHKYVRHRSSQDFYECPQNLTYATPHQSSVYDQKIYKSDSRVSILSEYSIRSESSNRNFRCGEVSDSSLGDSMFSYSTQRRYFGSSESCRFGFECRRCSLDGEKCSFSDTCRYECRNCDCSSSYFSSDFDEVNNSRKSSTRLSSTSQRSYEYYNDTVDVKQNKYAQDFIKHVNDVKRSIYQAELQRTTMPAAMNSYGTVPPPKQTETKKSINHYQQPQQQQQQIQQQQQALIQQQQQQAQQQHPQLVRRGSSPYKSPQVTFTSYTPPMMKDISSGGSSRDGNLSAEDAKTSPKTSITATMAAAPTESGVGFVDGAAGELQLHKQKPHQQKQQEHQQNNKFTEDQYAQVLSQRVNELSKQDKKDSTCRGHRKQTGAIPKSSATSSSSSSMAAQTVRSHRSSSKDSGGGSSGGSVGGGGVVGGDGGGSRGSGRGGDTANGNGNGGSSGHRATPPISIVKSIYATSPRHVNCSANKDGGIYVSMKSLDSAQGRMTLPAELKHSSASSKSTDSHSRASSVEHRTRQEKTKASKVRSEDTKGSRDNRPAEDPTTPNSNQGTSERIATTTKKGGEFKSNKAHKKRCVCGESKKEYADVKLLKPPRTTAWSDLDDDDDDVFFDARQEKDDSDDKKASGKKRCLALPATPNTPGTTSPLSPGLKAETKSDEIKDDIEVKPALESSTSKEPAKVEIVDSVQSPKTKTSQSRDRSGGGQSVAPTISAKDTSSKEPEPTASAKVRSDDTAPKKESLTDGGLADPPKAQSAKKPTSKARNKEKSTSSSAAEPSSKAKRQQTMESAESAQKKQLPKGEVVVEPVATADKLELIGIQCDDSTGTATAISHKLALQSPRGEPSTSTADSNDTAVTATTEEKRLQVETKLPSIVVDGIGSGDSVGPIVDTGTVGATSGPGGGSSADEISRKSDVAVVVINRDQKVGKKSSSVRYSADEGAGLDTSEATSTDDSRLTKESTRSSNELTASTEKIDISDLPLPDIPPKKKRIKAEKTYSSRQYHTIPREKVQHESLRDSIGDPKKHYTQRIQDGFESLNEAEVRKMHYHNMGHISAVTNASNSAGKPTYLFGENRVSNAKKSGNTDEIYLNKSGWVQVNSKRVNDENSASAHNRKSGGAIRYDTQNGGHKNAIRVIQIEKGPRDKPIYAVPRIATSKIEELISRSEARRNNTTPKYMRPGYKIVDPQIASILNERPGFLPVKTFMDFDSPPPITPILSPPPAFQDTKAKIRNNISVQLNSGSLKADVHKTNKGMVFSRSFEHDRKPTDYAETFSKSFDCNLSDQRPTQLRDRSPNFSTLTGCSPNYLTKKESTTTKSRDNSPKYQPVGPAAYIHPGGPNETPVYSVPRKLDKYIKPNVDRAGRSRRAQFTRLHPNSSPGNSRFRSFDTTVSQRLNSCDSGARSDLSNDEFDDDDDEMSSQFLSANYQSTGSFGRSQSNTAYIPKQRSLTPERYDSGSYQSSLRKQRSLTPESRSLTPEDRRKRGSQVSLNARHNSGSRTNTLERKQKFDDKSHSASRSSSSSSYSGRDYDTLPTHRRSTLRNSKITDEHRIRRSRSLQLSERSPSRSAQSHKMIVCLGGNQANAAANQPIYQQPIRSFPPTIRPNQIINDQTGANRLVRSSDMDKSHSFDFDYGYSIPNTTARLDFDKSRSFDEDYREQTNKMRYMTDSGLMRGDERLKMQRTTTAPRQTSPQNYGTRLCDHEMTYDMLRRTLDRSPIMDFSRDHDTPTPSMRSRDSLGTELNFLNERIYDQAIKFSDQSPSDSANYSIITREPLTPDSDHKSLREVFPTGTDDRFRPDYIYRQPTLKTPSQPSQRSLVDRSHQIITGSSAPALGSCTASSCDFWPHCGLTKLKRNKLTSGDQPKKSSATCINLGCDQGLIGATSDDYDDDNYHKKNDNNDNVKIENDDDDDDDDEIYDDDDYDDDDDGNYKNIGDCADDDVGVKHDSDKKTDHNSNDNIDDDGVANDDKMAKSKNLNQYANSSKIIDRDRERDRDRDRKSNRNRSRKRNRSHNMNCDRELNRNRRENNRRSDSENAKGRYDISGGIQITPPDIKGSHQISDIGKSKFTRQDRNVANLSIKNPSIDESKTIGKSQSGTVERVNVNSKPPTPTTLPNNGSAQVLTSSVVFFGEREMPITREKNKSIVTVNATRKCAGELWIGDISRASKTTNALPLQQQTTSQTSLRSQEQKRSRGSPELKKLSPSSSCTTAENKTKIRSPTARTQKSILSSKRSKETRRPRSLSLPNVLQGVGFSTTDVGVREQFPVNLIQQMRAVSSPSLSENPLEAKTPEYEMCSSKTSNGRVDSCHDNENVQQQYVGVLQKFKKTFTHFNKASKVSQTVLNPSKADSNTISQNGGSALHLTTSAATQQQNGTAQQNGTNDSDPTKYRFGPLIWRSSKERRKTKHNRRDKCNSGDSGIQIELETDENQIHDGLDCGETPSTSVVNVRIRRANSAKASNSMTSCSSVKAKALKKVENYENKIAGTPIPTRSLSQPSGLDRMTRADESDTDSVSSQPDLHEENNRPVFAEVLFAFTPAGPQELALEKGSLVEVLRKDTGPWWLGRIKYDAVIEEVIELQQGWFPKDFVRILPSPLDITTPVPVGVSTRQTSTIADNTRTLTLTNTNCDNSRLANNSTVMILSGSSSPVSATQGVQAVTTGTGERCTSAGGASLGSDETNYQDGRATTIGRVAEPISGVGGRAEQRGSTTTNTSSKDISPTSSRRYSGQNSETLRNNVVKELLETEINYVRLLTSLCNGFLKELHKRVDIFSTESLNLIFSNICEVLNFQQKFLDALRKGIENNRIAQVFLEHQAGFMVYSSYCNSYPRALMELESYSNVKEANIVLENCRVAEKLPVLPLSAHLLTPIQRICRYPLQLAELVRHTLPRQAIVHVEKENSVEIADGLIDCKESLEYALAAMKKVAEMVNEGKRHSENLSRFQASFENFQGPPIALHSTRFFMQTDATRVSPNLWNNTYTLFLFDHQLIYCKKDLLKRNHFIYKGRIFLDSCRILNLPDGKLFGMTLKNALRIFCEQRNKWFDFCFRSASRKIRFLSTLAAERQFCGTSIFVSELAGEDDDHLSDREYHSDYDTPSHSNERNVNAENFNNLNLNWKNSPHEGDRSVADSPAKQSGGYSDTLPKKSRKVSKDGYEYNTGSLGRRKIGSWFRKAKSTNTTPTQSPTHHSNLMIFNSDSSSQSSPALGYKPTAVKPKVKDSAALLTS